MDWTSLGPPQIHQHGRSRQSLERTLEAGIAARTDLSSSSSLLLLLLLLSLQTVNSDFVQYTRKQTNTHTDSLTVEGLGGRCVVMVNVILSDLSVWWMGGCNSVPFPRLVGWLIAADGPKSSAPINLLRTSVLIELSFLQKAGRGLACQCNGRRKDVVLLVWTEMTGQGHFHDTVFVTRGQTQDDTTLGRTASLIKDQQGRTRRIKKLVRLSPSLRLFLTIIIIVISLWRLTSHINRLEDNTFRLPQTANHRFVGDNTCLCVSHRSLEQQQ